MPARFLNATVILPAHDLPATARYYREKLGFSIEILWEDPPYGVAVRGQAVIEFGQQRFPDTARGVCYVHVGDVDEVYREFAEAGAHFVTAPADRAYGCRDFRVRDNNGNLLIVGSPLPGSPLSEGAIAAHPDTRERQGEDRAGPPDAGARRPDCR